jgi:hypothetical protein
MKQTAVEWLRQELLKRDMDISIKDLFEQAKEMEKEQIIDAYESLEHRHGENYYNETYKSEQ